VTQQPNSGLGRLIVEVSRSHTYTIGFLWTSDQLVAEAATCTTHKKIQETNHALGRFRTRDPINQATVDLRLRPTNS